MDLDICVRDGTNHKTSDSNLYDEIVLFCNFSVITYHIDPITMVDVTFKIHGLSRNLNISTFKDNVSGKCFAEQRFSKLKLINYTLKATMI